ncbi:MAG: putative zinc-binding protein [Candidatus Thorarchaeota archaeon]|jgi:uncharacterized metal-binding protein|nr:putative zinc-binding protein [Candidatus Thorarchaeota archaeon]
MSFKPKVGIISCSGEDCAGGNISREATLKALHELRPNETVTLCLPLFLAGDEGERSFAKTFPTITVDGCNKLCAAISTARFSSDPSVEINVEDYAECISLNPKEKWRIGESAAIVEQIAEEIARQVDRLREEWE